MSPFKPRPEASTRTVCFAPGRTRSRRRALKRVSNSSSVEQATPAGKRPWKIECGCRVRSQSQASIRVWQVFENCSNATSLCKPSSGIVKESTPTVLALVHPMMSTSEALQKVVDSDQVSNDSNQTDHHQRDPRAYKDRQRTPAGSTWQSVRNYKHKHTPAIAIALQRAGIFAEMWGDTESKVR